MGDQETWISQGQKSSSRQALGTLRSSVTSNLSVKWEVGAMCVKAAIHGVAIKAWSRVSFLVPFLKMSVAFHK